MKKRNIFYFIMALTILSCSHTPNELKEYINSNYELESIGNVSVDLRKALKTDYDTMYVFDAFTPISVVRNIIGIPDDYNYDDNNDSPEDPNKVTKIKSIRKIALISQ